MELRQLRYFLSAARHRSFTEAARECCVVQSAMSQQIKALEKELDVTLFERTKHGLRLTHEGQTLEQEATALLQQATQLHTAVAIVVARPLETPFDTAKPNTTGLNHAEKQISAAVKIR